MTPANLNKITGGWVFPPDLSHELRYTSHPRRITTHNDTAHPRQHHQERNPAPPARQPEHQHAHNPIDDNEPGKPDITPKRADDSPDYPRIRV